MNQRITRLRQQSFETRPSISIERAVLETDFYREHYGKHSIPVLRALCFKHLCAQKTIYIGDDELIVGERGPSPKAVPTFPELTCHSAEDLQILNDRPMTGYRVLEQDIQAYQEQVIPYWQGRSMRERIFSQVPEKWKAAYEAGLFTEFMEQRAPATRPLMVQFINTACVISKQRFRTVLSGWIIKMIHKRPTNMSNYWRWISPVMR